QKTKRREAVEPARHRSQHGDYGIKDYGHSQTATRADTIHEPAERALSYGIRDAESDCKIRIVRIGPVILELKIRSEKGKRLPVDVVDDGRGEQQAANPPAQRRNRPVRCGHWRDQPACCSTMNRYLRLLIE